MHWRDETVILLDNATYHRSAEVRAGFKKLGVPVKTNCKKGDCATCTVKVGGKAMRACIGKVPPAPKLKSVQEKGLPVKAR